MKLNHNKKSVKISLNLFALYAVLVCGIILLYPRSLQMTRWWSWRISPHSSFR